jgi:hypothetical protein
MFPTRDQIERAAYDRWLRRHRRHGHDRNDWIGSEHELTFALNYEVVVEYPLDSSTPLILGRTATPRCRLCERSVKHVSFDRPRPILQGASATSLHSAQVCDECQLECRDLLAPDCERLWSSLRAAADIHQALPRNIDKLAVFKSLVTSALLMMPESELGYFTDALEWVNNPDHEYDGALFAGTVSHVYRAPFLHERSWMSLARRNDDDAPFPYMILFVSWSGLIVQVSVPLSVRDHDLDGRTARLPVRSLTAGEGDHFTETRFTTVCLVEPPDRARKRARQPMLVM